MQYLVLLSICIQLLGKWMYIKDTLQWITKPNRISWLLRSISPLIAAAAAFSDWVTWGVLPVFMSGISTFLVFSASFINPQSYWHISKSDYMYWSLSIITLILRGITQEPLIAIILALISDICASMPTLVKSRMYPETESIATYSAWLISIATTFFALTNFSLTELLFPVYLFVLNILFIWIIFLRMKAK